ncbi:Phosphoadenosine phosphosulfate reductase thioredoxin [Nadsonia fulvescens var. elongata DSM 6958]|uniref:phosphoadenylyl-sulfate reductase (thioredoxin) n=1 Tax=Nadsonia fulvescens var. elongata DSM 6958 TaxID=857566 RepID=A0A1E3PPL1_9ASCO|nr:Phosphoadenosine phosphosulfate reductase thioredoxin [Nadsonia fulvescens var. elongata DSM 6958]
MTAPSTTCTAAIASTKLQLEHINARLQNFSPQEIIEWAITTIPNLYQTTAFGLTGLATIDMVSKMPSKVTLGKAHPIDLIFVDTLYHFDETLALVDNLKAKYPPANIHIYKPDGCESRRDFEKVYGENMWETAENLYDYLVKVEPAHRAYKELNVAAVLTGRRRSQGGARGDLAIIEIEEETGTIKINPLANWSFQQVKDYVDQNDVPYNSLLDKGYRSVGDFHSTQPVKEGEDERAGRWKGKNKTECGIHASSRFAQYIAVKKMNATGTVFDKLSL